MRWHVAVLILIYCSIATAQTCVCDYYGQQQWKFEEAIRFADTSKWESLWEGAGKNMDKSCLYLKKRDELFLRLSDLSDATLVQSFRELGQLSRQQQCVLTFQLDSLHLRAEYFQKADSIELATACAFALLEKAEAAQDERQQLKAYNILSTLYVRQGQEDEFIPYFNRALELITNSKSDKDLPQYLNWVARWYENKYAISEEIGQLDSAKIFADKALLLANQFGMDGQRFYAFQIKEAIAYHKGDYNQSLAYHDSTYHYIKKLRAYQKIPVYFQVKGLTLLELGKNSEAETHQDSALYYAKKYAQTSYLTNYYKQAVEVYGRLGLMDKAMQAFDQYTALEDSVYTESRTLIINELEQKYQKEKNEKTILELNHQKKMLLIGGLMLILIAGFIYLYYNNKSLKLKQEMMEIEQRLNRARMNPHFFFNTLASLQSFVLTDNDSMSVAENLSKFSHIMRETLENTYREYNSIQQELDFLREYLDLQQIRFPGKFEYTLINKINNPDHFLLPSMIVQPFVENSVEHGFADIGYTGKLEIFFSNDEHATTILIIDNGRGLDNQIQKAKTYISRASQIVKDRIYLLNLKLKSNAQFSIANNTSGEGVSVKIILPTIHEN